MEIKEILTTPKHGWCDFTFDKDLRISYINDFPRGILEAMAYSLENHFNFCFTIDAEGYDYSIVSPQLYEILIIKRMDEDTLTSLGDYDFKDFCLDFCYSIEKNIDLFSEFDCGVSIEVEYGNLSVKDEERKALEELISRIRKIINKEES